MAAKGGGPGIPGAKRTLDRGDRADICALPTLAERSHSGLAGRRPNICARVSRGVKGGETATLVCGFYGVGEGGVTAFTEYGHRVLEVRGVQFSTGQF